jgi:hypothetical protein
MKADAVPDRREIRLAVALDRQAGELGEATAVLERGGYSAEQRRGFSDGEVRGLHLLPSQPARLDLGQRRVDLAKHRRCQTEEPILAKGEVLARPDEGTPDRFSHAAVLPRCVACQCWSGPDRLSRNRHGFAASPGIVTLVLVPRWLRSAIFCPPTASQALAVVPCPR